LEIILKSIESINLKLINEKRDRFSVDVIKVEGFIDVIHKKRIGIILRDVVIN